jgi:hypothetical protein
MREHKGPLKNIVGYVWECGDDYCSCSKATIVEQYVNLADRRWIVPVCIWEGEFHTDGEPGANDELIAKRAELRESDPDLAVRIEWVIYRDPETETAGQAI